MPIFPKKVDAKKMYNTNKPLTYNKLDTSNLPNFKGGTAPGFGRVAKGFNIIKSFFQAPKQYLRSAGLLKTNREKVTKMPEKFFKNVKNQMEKNPNLKKSSPGYYTFKK